MLEFKNIKKDFGSKKVLDDVSFSIKPGEVIALLGMNGAGKTTSIDIMLGQKTPDNGKVLLFGMDPKIPQSREKVGSTPQSVDFPPGLRTQEILSFISYHYRTPLPINDILNKFNLQGLKDFPAQKLSGGQKRKLALAMAFVGNPSLIFLDEPTTGLDVATRKLLWQIIQEDVLQQGKSVLLTTHYLEEVEQVASRILVLHQGRILVDGTLADVKAMANAYFAEISFDLSDKGLIAPFEKTSLVDTVKIQGQKCIIRTSRPDDLIRELVIQQIPFQNLAITRDSLESAFLSLSTRGDEKC